MFSTVQRRLGLVLILICTFSLIFGSLAAQDDDSDDCPDGQGYWKNQPTWPVIELTLGGQVYTQAELLIILHTPVQGDASLNLAHQLIAAKLNVANGADATVAAGLISQADTQLSTFAGKLPYAVQPSSTDGQTMVNLGGVLDSYNNGQLTVNCIVGTLTPTPESTAEATPEATPESTPEATPEATPEMTPEATPESTPEATDEPDDDDLPITIVIEGPVQNININIITIYNINIELDDNDPNLTIIQVGDIVRIEGNTQSRDNTIIIIAVTVIVVNVDIDVNTGEIYRDDGSCNNPPPPWAPANGWRRRCETNNNNDNSGDDGMGMGMGDDD